MKKIKLLVDEISNNGNLGKVNDIEKIWFNIETIYSIFEYDLNVVNLK